ncbi:hypothetical protein RRG08_056075 [Elysia crispata]|uniref:Uncharacterized protein n=1 Tax=Elysia crispata TaxID=231223 RepID=A0AAE0ZCK6_9GAST|nr:hypothetical protein RRG08_056075 [Elysia crispata]
MEMVSFRARIVFSRQKLAKPPCFENFSREIRAIFVCVLFQGWALIGTGISGTPREQVISRDMSIGALEKSQM